MASAAASANRALTAALDAPKPAPALPSRHWVYTVLFGSFFASSFLRPEMPGILLDLFAHDMSAAATYQGVCDAIGAVLACVLVPWLGAVSDTHGRRTALIVTAACSSANVLVLAVSTALGFGHALTVWVFFAANTLSKVTTQSIAFSYVADVSTIERRSAVLLEAGALIYVFSAAGPFAAIALTAASDSGNRFDARSTAIALAAVLALSSVVAAYLIPDSKPPAKHEPQDGSSAERTVITNAGVKSYGAMSSSSPSAPALASAPASVKPAAAHAGGAGGGLVGVKFLVNGDRNVRLVAAITLVSQVAIMGTGQIYYLYLTQDKGFGRGDLAVCAVLGSAFTCAMMFAQLWLSRRVPMNALMALSAASFTVYCCGLAFAAESKAQVYALIGFFGLAHVLYTNASALMASLVPPNHLGLAMSALSGLKAFAGGVGPTSFALLFAHLVKPQPGHIGAPECVFSGLHCAAVPLVLGAAMALVAMGACVYLPVAVADPGRKRAAADVAAKLQALKQAQSSDRSADAKAGAGSGTATSAGDPFAAARAVATLKYRRALLQLMAAHRTAVATTAVPSAEELYHFQPSHIAVADADPMAATGDTPSPTDAAPADLSIRVEPARNTSSAARPSTDGAASVAIVTQPVPPSANDPADASGAPQVVEADAADRRAHRRAEWTALARWLAAADRGDAAHDTPPLSPAASASASAYAQSKVVTPPVAANADDTTVTLNDRIELGAADSYLSSVQRGMLLAALVAFIACAVLGVMGLERLFGDTCTAPAASTPALHLTAGVATSAALHATADTMSLVTADSDVSAVAFAAVASVAAATAAADRAECARAAGAVSDARALRILSLLGPPGVGKGALSRHILADYNTNANVNANGKSAKGKGCGKGKGSRRGGEGDGGLRWPQRAVHISTGDLIRAEMTAHSDIGRRVESVVRSGGLIDDATVLQLVTNKLHAIAAANTALAAATATATAAAAHDATHSGVCGVTAVVVLDGFPRRLSQIELWEQQVAAHALPPIRAVVSVTMRDDILAERRAGRRVCPLCGRSYNLNGIARDGYDLPARLPKYRSPDRCTADRTPLVRRPDDAPDVAAQRMAEWHADGPPMLSHFRATAAAAAGSDVQSQLQVIEVDKTRSARVLYGEFVQSRLRSAFQFDE